MKQQEVVLPRGIELGDVIRLLGVAINEDPSLSRTKKGRALRKQQGIKKTYDAMPKTSKRLDEVESRCKKLMKELGYR